MEPIINPWFFYFIDIGDSLDTLVLTIAVITGIIWVGLWIAASVMIDECRTLTENMQNKYIRFCWKKGKLFMIIMIITAIIGIAIPSKSAMVEMAVMQQVTPNNIEKGKEIVKSTTDYIFEKFEKLKANVAKELTKE